MALIEQELKMVALFTVLNVIDQNKNCNENYKYYRAQPFSSGQSECMIEIFFLFARDNTQMIRCFSIQKFVKRKQRSVSSHHGIEPNII